MGHVFIYAFVLVVMGGLAGCELIDRLPPLFGSRAEEPGVLLSPPVSAVIEADPGLWWPFQYAGLLGLVGGLASWFLMDKRTGLGLLILGGLIALVPVGVSIVAEKLALPMAIGAGVGGLGLVLWAVASWRERHRIGGLARERGIFVESEARRMERLIEPEHARKMMEHVGDRDFDPEYEVK